MSEIARRPTEPCVASFYDDKTIFVTGVTGFLGQVLLNQLLTKCPNIRTIYVLVRTKRNQSPSSRLQKVFSEELFAKTIGQSAPSSLNKVVALSGNLSHANLGLSEEDLRTLKTEVNVVFHAAATVRFDEPLAESLLHNVSGTRVVLEICKQMQNLQALIHVSTAYANCEHTHIEEKVYPPPFPSEAIYNFVDIMGNKLTRDVEKVILGKKPNTYIFAKSIAESLVSEASSEIPVAIVRPSIVTSSWKEPLIGWTNSFNGPSTLCINVGQGVLRAFPADQGRLVDFFPVDLTVNLMIVAATHVAKIGISKEPVVYNATSQRLNPVTWGDFGYWSFQSYLNNPFHDAFWHPTSTFLCDAWWFPIKNFFTQYFPAKVVDTALQVSGRKPILFRYYEKLSKAAHALQYFTTREWTFDNDNVISLWDGMHPKDQEDFLFDISQVDMKLAFGRAIIGGMKYLMKRTFDKFPEGRVRIRIMYWLHHFLQFLVIFLAVYFFFNIFEDNSVVEDAPYKWAASTPALGCSNTSWPVFLSGV